MRRLPPLSTLRSFEATARLGSVTRAAEELGRTHGAVSRQLRVLQESLGLPLFDKVGVGLKPNGSGLELLRAVGGAFDDLEREWERLRSEARGPALHVACSATFAMRWMVPRLPDFYRNHPDMRLRLSMTTAQALPHEGADLVIAWDRRSYPAADRARAVRLAEVAFGPVCAPGYRYVRASGHIMFETRIAHDFTSRSWDTWCERELVDLSFVRELRFPHTHLCIEAALGGLGVALAERRLVEDDVAAGRLVAPAGFAAFEDGLAAIPASERAGSPAAGRFLAWLGETLARETRPERA